MVDEGVYFDLTEALLANTVKRVQYYGIARTVCEAAVAVASLNSKIRFVVFSFGDSKFYEVPCRRFEDGSVEFGLPRVAGLRWKRSYYGAAGSRSQLGNLLTPLFRAYNRRQWGRGASALRGIEIQSGSIFSVSRPKLLVDMIRSLIADRSTAKIVPLLHDFIPLHEVPTVEGKGFNSRFLLDNHFIVSNCDHVITNSQFTKIELEHFSAIGVLPSCKKITAIPLVQFCPEGREQAKLILPSEPFLLTVGSNLGRKNIEVVFAAMLVLHDTVKTVPKLVIAGAIRKRLQRYIALEQFSKIADRIEFVSNPSQTDLVRLYKSASAVLVPSRIEGWGLPAGEALWCGTPVICSTSPVFKEVCGDLGLYFDPDDAQALSTLIHNLTSGDKYVSELKARISEAKYSFRTWKAVGEDILAAING